ncbi:PRD domain-containing protein [Enterococcus avium]|uniref:PRD domain-containing protein n=1 Tax=Enterococcus avium TaxID=33945 RepID=UPI002A908D18|nr:PRD domain-containing protein [Enterococcus avium]MDY6442095.1 PRD domain-containing protein [Enterococcus avium]MDY6447855.1 PRD domain-containing protein [Enterococcus avium]MDY6454313.1 PRD domain-containing protein [Enterococcus avium]MDY6474456.1 PRD domain-containing protein [Enterococcus avium]
MKVIKVLNNSLVLAVDDDGHEIVLMGKGIGYNKSIGYKVVDEDIQKVFVLKDRSISNSIIQLANEIDAAYFELAKTIIDYAIEKYNMSFMDYIYLSLTDHIALTVKRIKLGVTIPNLYNVVIRQFNHQEYEIGMFAVNLIKEKLSIDIPEEEIGNIAIHFINAQTNISYGNQDNKISSFVNSILSIVQYNFMIEYDVDGVAYNRFIIHLQSFSQRLIYNSIHKDDINNELYETIIDLYPEEKKCADKIGKFIFENYKIRINHQEIVYLTIHIHKVLEDLGGER